MSIKATLSCVRDTITAVTLLLEQSPYIVRECRFALGWPQVKLGRALGVSVNYVSMMERGTRTPSLEMLEQLCKVMEDNGFAQYK